MGAETDAWIRANNARLRLAGEYVPRDRRTPYNGRVCPYCPTPIAPELANWLWMATCGGIDCRKAHKRINDAANYKRRYNFAKQRYLCMKCFRRPRRFPESDETKAPLMCKRCTVLVAAKVMQQRSAYAKKHPDHAREALAYTYALAEKKVRSIRRRYTPRQRAAIPDPVEL
ncbi:MAG: hypothetical protein NVS1B14_11620 [Vulcanimicrobiaceae bacterium]